MDMLSLILAAAVAAGTPTPAPEPCSVLTPGESQVVAETNAARSQSGQPTLEVDCRLMASARRHARQMARQMSMQHSREAVAENVASGQPTAREAVVVWLRSPGHRANILNPRHRRIGVAGFIGPDGRAYWVQQFSP